MRRRATSAYRATIFRTRSSFRETLRFAHVRCAQLIPYVQELLEEGASSTKLVLQHARSVVAHDGTVNYVAR